MRVHGELFEAATRGTPRVERYGVRQNGRMVERLIEPLTPLKAACQILALPLISVAAGRPAYQSAYLVVAQAQPSSPNKFQLFGLGQRYETHAPFRPRR